MRVRDAAIKIRSLAATHFFPGSCPARLIAMIAIALTVANCSNVSGIDPRYGVSASPKVVADGEPIPKGGGRQMVGKPYTVAGRTYVPAENPNYAAEGLASWYGPNFHGRMTANGEVFDRNSIAAAHTTMPLPSYARVTNLQNNHSIIVRVNDRGPYHGNRIVDVSEQAAEALDFKRNGTARVRVEYVGRASPNGSDDRILLASLRTDGRPASLSDQPVGMVAQANSASATRVAAASQTYDVEAMAAENAEPSAPGQGGRVNVPLPPRRPLDLGMATDVAPPARAESAQASNVLPHLRPTAAALTYAPVVQRVSTFGPMGHSWTGEFAPN